MYKRKISAFVSMSLTALLLVVGCGGSEDCRPTQDTICRNAAVYSVDSCGAIMEHLAFCACGCDQAGVSCDGPCQEDELCFDKECGPDGQGGSCGDCSDGMFCFDGKCACQENVSLTCNDGDVYWIDSCGNVGDLEIACEFGCADGMCSDCVPDCAGRECGPDPSCGTSCGVCSDNMACESGQCICTPNASSACHNGDVYSFDSCGNLGDLIVTCEYGCENGECEDCIPDCGERECGADPVCNMSCGQCSADRICESGQCVCRPNETVACSGGNVHWVDSCGNVGSLKEACDYGCADGSCLPCSPNCAGKNCGPDGCGGVCGNCTGGDFCYRGTCVECNSGETRCVANILQVQRCVNGRWETEPCADYHLCAGDRCREVCGGHLASSDFSAICYMPTENGGAWYSNDQARLSNPTFTEVLVVNGSTPAPVGEDSGREWPYYWVLECIRGAAAISYRLDQFASGLPSEYVTLTSSIKRHGAYENTTNWMIAFRNADVSLEAYYGLVSHTAWFSISQKISWTARNQLHRNGEFNSVAMGFTGGGWGDPCDTMRVNWLLLEIEP